MKRSNRMLAVLATTALLLAACSSDDTSSNSTAASTTGASTTAGSTTTGASGTGATVTTGAPQQADASKSPVLVGFHNLEGGALSLPEVREGFESGMNYVNEELGGINGHPMKADLCKLDVTPESSVNCANEFVEKNVVMAVQGVDVAADAMLPVIKQAGIVEFGFFAFTPGMNNAVGDAYFSLFSQEEGFAADLMTQQSLGAKKEAVVQADLPTTHALLDSVIKPTAAKLGMEIAPFFYPTTADWTTLAATILASDPDAISLTAAEDSVCLAAVPALREAGFKGVIHASSCSEIIDELPVEQLQNVISHNEFYYPTFTQIPAKAQADIDTYMRYIKRDFPNFTSLVYTQLGFHVAVQAADILRQIPGDAITAADVKAGITKTKGGEFFRDSDNGYDCSKPSWPNTTACGTGLIFTKITSDRRKEPLPNQPVDVSSVRPAG
ncbi:MAG: ABC transporter substrate-binding protein [Ilumatobacteraceae bacterium]